MCVPQTPTLTSAHVYTQNIYLPVNWYEVLLFGIFQVFHFPGLTYLQSHQNYFMNTTWPEMFLMYTLYIG